MFKRVCDWCGGVIPQGTDNAEFQITVERESISKRLERQWAQEVLPTMFFCVEQGCKGGELDRMGLLMVDPDETPSSCLHRALVAIMGKETAPPDMGWEWQLVPIIPDSELTLPTTGAEPEDKWTPEFIAKIAASATAARGPDGIGELNLSTATYGFLLQAGVVNICTLRGLSDEALMNLRYIGAIRVREIRKALGEFLTHH